MYVIPAPGGDPGGFKRGAVRSGFPPRAGMTWALRRRLLLRQHHPPVLDLALHELPEIFGRAVLRDEAHVDEALLKVRRRMAPALPSVFRSSRSSSPLRSRRE